MPPRASGSSLVLVPKPKKANMSRSTGSPCLASRYCGQPLATNWSRAAGRSRDREVRLAQDLARDYGQPF